MLKLDPDNTPDVPPSITHTKTAALIAMSDRIAMSVRVAFQRCTRVAKGGRDERMQSTH